MWPRRDNEVPGREGTARVDSLAAEGRRAARKAGLGSRQSGRSVVVYLGSSGGSVVVYFAHFAARLWPVAGLLSDLLFDLGRSERMRG